MYRKYNARKVEYNGIKFDSMMERDRYIELEQMLKDGIISNLQLQVPIEILPKYKRYRALKYIADFVYIKDGVEIVEDVKGFKTDVYQIKKRLVDQLKGIEIYEFEKPKKGKKRTTVRNN